MTGKAIAYFFIGFISALTIVELTNKKPPVKVNYIINNSPRGYFDYRPLYYRSWDYQYNPYSRGNNSGNVQSRNNNNGERRPTGTTNAGAKKFDHTEKTRTKSWGTRN
jgi:hypothetical protein